MFVSLFFVFGSFSIIAGVVLIANIFTMLGEERKSEMGMARAVGMQRGHLRKLFIYEGFIYALATAAIGSLTGLLLAYGLIMAVGMVLDLGGVNMVRYFTFTPLSMLIAYIAGFSLTMVSIYGITHRISNMNIVRAIRNIPEPQRPRGDRKALRMGVLAIIAGATSIYAGISSRSLGLALGGYRSSPCHRASSPGGSWATASRGPWPVSPLSCSGCLAWRYFHTRAISSCSSSRASSWSPLS